MDKQDLQEKKMLTLWSSFVKPYVFILIILYIHVKSSLLFTWMFRMDRIKNCYSC